MDDGTTTVVALLFADGTNIRLWTATTGCTAVSTGYISGTFSASL